MDVKNMAQDIWPAAGQIFYRLYDQSNFVTGQTRLAMTGQTSDLVMARSLNGPMKAGYLTGHRLEHP